MFRVICIEDSEQYLFPKVKKGDIYHVTDVNFIRKTSRIPGFTHPKGNYYTLLEMGEDYEFHESLFIKINDNQIDETELERNYQKEKVNNKS